MWNYYRFRFFEEIEKYSNLKLWQLMINIKIDWYKLKK